METSNLPSLHLVDIHSSIADAVSEIGWKDIQVYSWTDIKDFKIEPYMAFVSPANSLAFMDGGVDYVLSRVMFPDIENKVKKSVSELGMKTLLGRPFIPIGQSLTVPTQYNNVYLISAPTMWLPQDVHETHNAYHAMYSVLREVMRHGGIKKLIFTGFCTGVGMMQPKVAIQQMKDAYDDFTNQRPPKWSVFDIIHEQPNYYMNTEFKYIHSNQITH